MKKNLIFVTVLLLGLASGFAESSELAFSPKKMSANYDAREKDTFADSEKHYLTAISVMLLDNIFISGWNRFVSKSDWAKVTVDDMLEFYDKKMEWDTDWYWTNFVLHPYQGGLYYQAARSSNLNQLESFGVTVLGSSIWEWFCERNAPSKNDMVYTTVGAFAMGEMFYRLSIEAREINKFFGYAMNPNSMITQLTTGEKTRGTTGNIHELSFKFEMGAARTFTSFEKIILTTQKFFRAL